MSEVEESCSSSSSSSSSKGKTFAQKQAERLDRLTKLKMARGEARLHNHQEVVAEDARAKLPEGHVAAQKKLTWLKQQEAEEAEAEAMGRTYARHKIMNTSAAEAETRERLAAKKRRPDEGFSSYERATERQYERLVKQLPPKDMERYQHDKERLGEAFYGGAGHVIHGLHKDRKDAIDKMVDDVEKQIAKRQKYSRRRMHNDDADVDYINERNAKFNKKLERFYGEHTIEIKQNLERGTAV